jgi:hypothetical protein
MAYFDIGKAKHCAWPRHPPPYELLAVGIGSPQLNTHANTIKAISIIEASIYGWIDRVPLPYIRPASPPPSLKLTGRGLQTDNHCLTGLGNSSTISSTASLIRSALVSGSLTVPVPMPRNTSFCVLASTKSSIRVPSVYCDTSV